MGRGSEYLLEDLQRTLQLNSIHEAAELCEAVGLEVNVMSETAATVTLPRVRDICKAPIKCSSNIMNTTLQSHVKLC